MPWRASPRSRVLREIGLGEQVDLVHDRPRDLHARALEQRLVEHDLIDRAADAAFGDDHRRRTEHRGHLGVRKPDDGADPGVPGALDEQHVAVRGERRMGGHDPAGQVLDDLAIDVALREPARDVDRAHLPQRLGEVEHGLHQDGVLVRRDAFLDDRALPDRLDEPGRQATALEAVHDPEAERGLATVLAGRGEVDVAHRSGDLGRRAGLRRHAREPSGP